MSEKIVECIPNFSEGSNKFIINEISKAASSVEGAKLININSDESYNRSVFTIIGSPISVIEATFQACKTASKFIDMNKHKGEHPRIGAIDATPFVPVQNVTIQECIEMANKLGKRIANELGIPVFLYGEATKRIENFKLQDIRKPEYEGLKELIGKDRWIPDFGKPQLHSTAGAMPLGVRSPMIAFNITLSTNNVNIAKKIAQSIREVKGGFSECRAIGVYIAERDLTQVSIMLNHQIVPLYRILELIRFEANRYGINIVGTDICGLVSRQALLDSCEYYLQLENFDRKEQILEEYI